MALKAGAHAAARDLAVLALAAFALVLLAQYTELDLRLADAMFDPVARAFPNRDAWWATVVAHRAVKAVLVAAAGAILAGVAFDAFARRPGVDAEARARWRAVAACVVAIPATIALLKYGAAAHCPWDLQRYGGNAPYVRLLDALPAGVEKGRCLPAGHASSGLWLAALGLAFPSRRRVAARAVFCGGLAVGLALGWVQQLRGAHFLTHTLWSAWIAWMTVWVARVWLDRARARPGRP